MAYTPALDIGDLDLSFTATNYVDYATSTYTSTVEIDNLDISFTNTQYASLGAGGYTSATVLPDVMDNYDIGYKYVVTSPTNTYTDTALLEVFALPKQNGDDAQRLIFGNYFIVDFFPSLIRGRVPEVVTFTNTSVLTYLEETPGFGAVYTWDYGDGSPNEVSFNGSHEYTKPGVYTVTLTAVLGNETQTEEKMIYIYPAPLTTHKTNKSFTLGINTNRTQQNTEAPQNDNDKQGV